MSNPTAESQRPSVRLMPLFLLLAGTVAVVVWAFDFRMVNAYRQLMSLTDAGSSALAGNRVRSLPPAQRVIMEGDTTRGPWSLRQKAIWEAHPLSKVYYHNYLTVLLADYEAAGTNAAARYACLSAAVDAGRKLDPDNARLNFVQAAKLLELACEFKTKVLGMAGGGKNAKIRSEMVVKDRAALDRAMALLRAGLTKPVYRRYTRDMLAERLDILGPSRSLADLMSQLLLAASVVPADDALQRSLARGAMSYAELLVAEGRSAEAPPYLEAWRGLALRLNDDSFALIDVLLTAAIVKEAELKVPELYQKIGRPADAARIRDVAGRLSDPVRAWSLRRTALEKDPSFRLQREAFMRSSGILALALLPAMSSFPAESDLAPSRRLDYVMIEDVSFSVMSFLALAAMVVCLAVVWAKRRRTVAPDDAAGAGWANALVVTAGGILAPLAVYFLVTRWTPFGGRDFGLPYAWPKAMLQIGTLGASMVLAVAWLIGRDWRRDAGAAGRRRGAWRLLGGGVAVLAVLSLLPVAWLNSRTGWAVWMSVAPVVLLVAAGLWALVSALWGRRRAAQAPSRMLTARALMPVLALAAVLLSLGARSVLRLEERRLVAQEKYLSVDIKTGGFTTAEARLTRQLSEAIRKAAE